MKKQIYSLFIILTIIFSSFIFAEDAEKIESIENDNKEESPLGISPSILSSMQDRNYEEAIKQINEEIGKDTIDNADILYYLKGLALFHSEKYDESIQNFQKIIDDYAKSTWIRKAHFAIVTVLLKQKEFDKAYDIYKKQLTTLLDTKRRNDIAMYYVNLARTFCFQEDKTKNNYSEAINFFNKAVEIGLNEPEQEKVLDELSRSYYENNRYSDAIKSIEEYIEKYKDSDKVATLSFYLGMSYLKSNINVWKGRQILKKLTDDYKGSDFSPKALLELAKSYRFPTPYSERDLEIGVRYLQDLIEEYPSSEEAPTAAYYIGQAYHRYYHLWDKAIKEYRNFINKYPKDENAPDALKNIGDIYLSQGDFERGIKIYHEFLVEYPNDKNWKSIQQEIINIRYKKPERLYTQEKYDEAVPLFLEFMETYPIDYRNPDISNKLAEVKYKKDDFDGAVEQWKKTASKYPNTQYSSEANYRIGMVYAYKQDKFEEALKEFEKANYSNFRSLAQEEINKLKSEQLQINVKKVYSTNEKPQIELVLRNLKKVEFKIYELDAKEYFEKYHTIKNVEQLDTVLIAADKTFEKDYTENFKKYKLLTENIDLPVEGCGAYVISAHSGEYKSTALFLVNDLGMIARASRSNLLVFSKNLEKSTPVDDVTVWVTNNNKILEKGKTNPEGIFEADLSKWQKEGEDTNQLYVFSYKGKHFSSTEVYTGDLSYPTKDKEIGYIFTDKTIYKPGDTIFYKAILRIKKESQIIIPDIDKFDISFSTQNGKIILKENKVLSAFGTFYGKIKIPEDASLGYGNLSIVSEKNKDKKVYTYSKSIEINKFEKEEREVIFDMDKPAYFPGDTIKLTIQAKHLFGVPFAGKTIHYKIGKEDYKKEKLDDDGKLKLDIEPSQYGQVETLYVYVKLEGSNKVFSHIVSFIMKDFSIEVQAEKFLHLPDEEVIVNVNTVDFNKKGVSKTLKVKIDRTFEGTTSTYDESTIQTGDDGKEVYKFTPKGGGDYVIKFEGESSNKVSVRISTSVRIIDKEKGNKLEIVTKELPINVGEEREVIVYSKASEGLALFTVEAEKTLESRHITLSKGINRISLSAKEEFVPIIKINVDLVEREGYYHAEKILDVKSGIKVKVETDKKEYKPREEVEIKIETKKMDDSPTKAELAIAVVDSSVLSAAAAEYEDIDSRFYEKQNLNFYRQSGSTPFIYNGFTEKLDSALLKEKEYRFEADRAKITANGDDFDEDGYYGYDNKSIAGTTANGYKEKKAVEKKEYSKYDKLEQKAVEAPEVSDDSRKSTKKQPVSMITDIQSVENTASVSTGLDMDMLILNEEVLKNMPANLYKIILDTAYYKGDATTDDNGEAKINFNLPDNNTKWKIIVIANNKGSLFGMGQTEFASKQKLVPNIDTPLAILENDKFVFNVDLSNASDEDQSGNIKITAEDDGGENLFSASESFTLKPSKTFSTSSKNIKASDKDINISIKSDGIYDEKKIKSFKWGQNKNKSQAGILSDSDSRTITLDEEIDSGNFIDKKLSVILYPYTSDVFYLINNKAASLTYGLSNHVATNLITNLYHYKYLKSREADNAGEISRTEKQLKDIFNIS